MVRRRNGSWCLLLLGGFVSGFQFPKNHNLALSTKTAAQGRTISVIVNNNKFKSSQSIRSGSIHSSLFLAGDKTGLEQHPGNPDNRWRRAVLALRQAMANAASYPRRFAARFSRLSKVGKTIVLMQLLVISLLFGSVSRKIYVNTQRASPAPVEIPYSNFLDMVDKKNAKELADKGISVENVRIGADRIVYRVVKEPETSGEERSAAIAYTRQVSASPELVSHLRNNNVPFGAMPKPGPNPVAAVARSAILMFYMLILFRMYRSFSGNSSGDVPGKLATSNLPLASFDDIQGIDEAKTEVMELVDTLRNPSKYAILGARAPTGLLLEGPPGAFISL